MRAWVCFALLLPSGALADTILAGSQVTSVTIYPQGAQVVREVVFEAPAGPHEVLITDLPAYTDPGLLRLTSADTDLGAFALRSDRLPPRGEDQSPDVVAAKAAVKAAEAGLRDAQAKVDAIAAEVEAAQARITFLTGVKVDGAATAEGLQAMSAMIGAQVLAARQAALAAEVGLPEAEEAVAKASEAVTATEDALAALSKGDEDYVALSVSVTAKGGTGHLTISHFVYDAGWAPVYDMALDRKAGKVTVSRGVLVSQASGEDWAGVDLTLSTAQPSEQAAPSEVYPDLRSVADPAPEMADGAFSGGVAEAAMAPEPVVTAAPAKMEMAAMAYQGDTVVYHYPSAVDVADGVESLRLALDELSLPATVQARAVPRYDKTAFVLAKVTNDGAAILLPGTAYLYRDGALVGSMQIEALAPGAQTELGFGAIDGIRLKRDMPERAEGDRGIISTSTQIEEKAVLQVENLTGEAWPMRVVDQVPYSEQEELEISYSAEPTVSEADVDGKRGVLAWDFDLAAGEKKAITLESVMSWPEGKVLQ